MKTRARKRGRGRPALPPDEVREMFSLRITETERNGYEAAAAGQGKTLRQWVVDTLNEATAAQLMTGDNSPVVHKLAKAG